MALTPFEESKKKTPGADPHLPGSYSSAEKIYSPEEMLYRKFLVDRLKDARTMRDQPHDELDGMTYPEYYESNQKAAISYIAPRANKDETQIVTGTTREKKIAIMSSVLNLDFNSEIHAYDEDDFEDVELGYSMTDLVKKSAEIENWDDEGRLLAYDELTTQGNVFIEDLHVVETKWDKKKVKLDKDFTLETFKTFKPEKKIKEVFRGARRTVIPGIFVYLGNIKEFQIEQQPYIFTVEVIPWEEAKALYGDWPRWNDVPKSLKMFDASDDQNVYGMNFRVSRTVPEGWCEVVKYQDKWNDEYQILLNGCMQLPVEFPMPWESGEYSIVKGNLEPIGQFAYCKSVPAKSKVDQQVLDEMYRLAILKTQKSFLPPIANYSANILSKNAFLPGKVNNDLEKGDIEVLGGDPSMYSLKNSELAMIQLVKKFIDEKSVNPSTMGQEGEAGQTATEIKYIQRQAKINLGLMIFGFMALQKKLDTLRLSIGLENWTKAMDTTLDETKTKIINKYQSFTVHTEIGDEGMGEKVIQFTDEFTPPEQLVDQEEGIMRDQNGKMVSRKKNRKPKRIVQISPKVLRSIKYRWHIIVTASEKETSETTKILFEDSVIKAGNLFGIQSLNLEYLKQKWALYNKIAPNKFFLPGAASQVPSQLAGMGAQPNNQIEAQMKPSKPGVNELT